MDKKRNKIAALGLVLALSMGLSAAPAWAASYQQGTYQAGRPSAAAMFVDGLLVRPLGIVATALGSVTWLVTLPFSALGDNVGEAGQSLVKEPARFTFARPLGEFPR